MSNGRRGFTLVEALVSVTLLAVGVTSTVAGFSSLTTNWLRARDTERMQRLAIDKYDELISTGALQSQSLNGDFSDRGEDGYLWDATVETTGVENLSALTITVQPRDNQDTQPKAEISGLTYIPPETTDTPGGATP